MQNTPARPLASDEDVSRAHRSPQPARAGPALAAVGLVLLVFLAPALLGRDEFRYRDTGRMHAPMKVWIGAELRRGRLPEWNPFSGLGTPVIANGIDAVQHPFTLLFVVLPPGIAMKAWILLSFALAAGGTFAWLRALGGSPPAAALGACAFALSGPLVSSTDNVQYLTAYAALPLLLAAGRAHAAGGGPGRLLGVGLASYVCAAAGDPQSWAIATAALPVVAVAFAEPSARGTAVRRGLAQLVAAAIGAAPVLLPIWLWLPFSERAHEMGELHLTRWALHPRRLVELAVPEVFRGPASDPMVSPVFRALAGNAMTEIPWFLSVYLGASTLALAAVGALRDRRARLLAAFAGVFLWAGLGHYAGFGQLVRHVPVLGAFRYWEKVLSIVALLAATCAARGGDEVLAGRAPRILERSAAVAGALLLAVAGVASAAPATVGAAVAVPPPIAAALSANIAEGARHSGLVLLLLAVVLVAIRTGRVRRAAPVALGAILAVDLFGGNAGAYVLSPPPRDDAPPLAAQARAAGGRVVNRFALREDTWPELGRVASMWEWARRTLVAAFNVPLAVTAADEYVGLREIRWLELRAGEKDPGRLGLFGFGLAVVPKDPALAGSVGLRPPYHVAGVDPALPAYLVEVPHRDRLYVAEDVTGVDAAGALAFARAGGEPGRTVVEAAVPEGYAVPTIRDVRFVRDDPTHVECEARVDREGLLVLSDSAAPGWTATVDGEPAPIVRANYVARGVWLPAGVHRVRFDFRTPGLAVGWGIALAGMTAIAAWAVALRLRRRRSGGAVTPA